MLTVYLWKEPVPSPDTTSRKNMNSSNGTTFPSHGQQRTPHVNTNPSFRPLRTRDLNLVFAAESTYLHNNNGTANMCKY